MIRMYREYISIAAFMVYNTHLPVLLLYVQVQYVCMYSHQSAALLGKVTKPARGQLNREDEYFPVPVRA